jgi:hypothetical protein
VEPNFDPAANMSEENEQELWLQKERERMRQRYTHVGKESLAKAASALPEV